MADTNKYVLVEVIEQDISEPTLFGDRASAAHELRERLKLHAGLTDEDLDAARPVPGHPDLLSIDGDAFMLLDDDGLPCSASAECRGQNFDCRVFGLPGDPSDGDVPRDEGFVVHDKATGLWYVGLGWKGYTGLGWSRQLREAKIYHSRRYAEDVRAKFPGKETETVPVSVRVTA